jgi:peptidyl-tRNA hydrolase, PTH1 family
MKVIVGLGNPEPELSEESVVRSIETSMKVIVGLGNPGSEYELTRHNAGFQVLIELGTVSGGDWKLVKNLQSATIKGRIGPHDVVLAMPQTYMNLSGEAVLAVLQWFKVSPKDMLVVHDDVSMNLGRLRLQKGGGAGGQHGIESIIDVLGGNKDFDRLKVGVGPDPGGDVRGNYVLSRLPEADRELFRKSILTGKDAVLSWLDKGIDATANVFNGKVLGLPLCLQALEEERKRKQEEEKKKKEDAKRKADEERKKAAEERKLFDEADEEKRALDKGQGNREEQKNDDQERKPLDEPEP